MISAGFELDVMEMIGVMWSNWRMSDVADTPSSRGDDGEGDDEKPAKRPKSRKNPNVDTSFLPDREREEEERRQREELRQEWLRKQEEMKKEEIEITYSYWDGSGHRKSATVRAGSSFIGLDPSI